MMNKEEIEYCLKQFYKNKHAFRFENGLKISMYKVFEQLEDLQQRIDKAIEYINSEEFFMKMNSNSIQPPADKYVCQDYFEANPISNITVCSLHGREAASSIPPVLIDNYEKLRIHYPEINLKYIGESIFQDSIQLGLDRAYDFLQMSEDGVKKNLKLSEIRTAKEHSLAELREVIEDFVKRYNVDRFSEMEGTNPILLAYNELLQTYAYLMGN